MHSEILAIGDEIINGQILDTNTQWLSLRLQELGIRVLYHTSVGDELDPLAEVFRHAFSRADVVLATGGLGPTADDLTREALAKAVGRKLVLDPQALEHVRDIFARRKREMPKRNELQAMFPEGARMVHNPNGTAPGIELDVPRQGRTACRVICLPGVPAEMEEMWADSVGRSLHEFGAGDRIILHKRIKCFGAGESQMEAMLPEGFLRRHKPAVGINASQATIIFRIVGEGSNAEQCRASMQPAIATIRRCLGTLVYGEDDDELQDAVVRLVRQKRSTLAAAEWGTAGLVTQWLAGAPQSDGCFLGGAIVPNEAALRSVLGIDAEVLQRHVLGSGEVVQAMAAAARKRFGSDYALAIGRFPPVDPSAVAPPPVFFALAGPEGVKVKEFPFAAHPALWKVLPAKQALNMVRLALL